jgi:hypothetical protein
MADTVTAIGEARNHQQASGGRATGSTHANDPQRVDRFDEGVAKAGLRHNNGQGPRRVAAPLNENPLRKPTPRPPMWVGLVGLNLYTVAVASASAFFASQFGALRRA